MVGQHHEDSQQQQDSSLAQWFDAMMGAYSGFAEDDTFQLFQLSTLFYFFAHNPLLCFSFSGGSYTRKRPCGSFWKDNYLVSD